MQNIFVGPFQLEEGAEVDVAFSSAISFHIIIIQKGDKCDKIQNDTIMTYALFLY
jgi:hypothetical protein